MKIVLLMLLPFVVVSAFADAGDLEERKRSHWAWQPIGSPTPPSVKQSDWPRDAIDHFILARLEERGLAPAPETERRTWLRRVTFDLTGLPPTPHEVREFDGDSAADAYRTVVSRLLGSKRFGEHWAQHWLDLVRYSETRGHEGDFDIPEAFRYRDYVIRALDADVSYDRFVVEHLAGDLIEDPRIEPELRTNESIQGTGFWHLGEATHSPVDIRGDEADRVANQIDVFGKTFLGLTLACARCHDHKFDAIAQEDYYAIFGFLQSSGYQLADVSDPDAQRQAFERARTLQQESAPALFSDWVGGLSAQRDGLSRYLGAAADVLTGKAVAGDLAASAKLDAGKLAAWVNALQTSVQTPTDPLFGIAQAAKRVGAGNSVPESVQRTLEAWRLRAETSEKAPWNQEVTRTIEDGERNYVSTTRKVNRADFLIDFDEVSGNGDGGDGDDQRGSDDWITSGYVFGNGPATVGEIVLGRSPNEAIARVVEEGSARTDLVSRQLSGMLRTRTFEVTSDSLWYRFLGKAKVFLAVDSHRVVVGPLHKVVQQTIENKTAQYAWSEHKVSDYIGHRVHVEFLPEGDFSLSAIRYCSKQPIESFDPNTFAARALQRASATLADLAQATIDEAVTALQRLAKGELSDTAEKRDAARAANWFLAAPSLLPLPEELTKRVRKRFAAYHAERGGVEQEIPKPIRAVALFDGSAEREPVHIRGDHKTRSEHLVPRRLLSAIDPSNRELGEGGSGRLELARRLVDPSNPLVSRVFVNRVWHHLFGRGIVATVDDFGVMGQRPSHPQLLDHLADGFRRDGWSLKRLLERLVLSSAYRMSSRPNEPADELDPDNVLLHRMRIRRLRGEAIRDSLLAISGRLDPTKFGPSVPIHITDFMRSNRSPKGSGPMDGAGRRSIYVEVRRNHLSHFLTAFDKPIPFTSIGRRIVSNSPAQPLALLNDPLVHEQARLWAKKLLGTKSDALESDARALIDEAYLSAFGRTPEAWERDAAIAFLGDRTDAEGAWTELCHTLFNVKEFIFIR